MITGLAWWAVPTLRGKEPGLVPLGRRETAPLHGSADPPAALEFSVPVNFAAAALPLHPASQKHVMPVTLFARSVGILLPRSHRPPRPNSQLNPLLYR